MSPGAKWIFGIVSLLVINTIAAVILIVVANSQGHSQVLPSYKFEAGDAGHQDHERHGDGPRTVANQREAR